MPKYLVTVIRVATQARTMVVDAENEESIQENASQIYDCANDLEPWFTDSHYMKSCDAVDQADDGEEADLRV